MSELIEQHKEIIIRVSIIIAVLLGLFLLVGTASKLKEYRYIGSGTPAGNTITVNGIGNIERAPDTARITFTMRSTASTVALAQETVTDKIVKITADLENAGVDKDDISTASYSSYPQYSYPENQKPVLQGYEVSQAVTVKIKNLDIIEAVISILGTNNVTDIQGPNFGFDDDKAVAREARELAIKDAKEQAKQLARDLDVDLVRIVSFSEQSQGGTPVPMFNRETLMVDQKAGSANIPVGTADVQSSVTIVYEIR